MKTLRIGTTATMHASSRLILVWAAGLAVLGAPVDAGAQSLDINRPAPLPSRHAWSANCTALLR